MLVTQVRSALQVVVNALERFSAGEFEGLEPIPGAGTLRIERGEAIPGSFPEPVGWLYEELAQIEWWEGPLERVELLGDLEELLDGQDSVAELEVETVLKLLALHLRQERFCEGHFLDMVQRGHMRALLTRFRVLAEGHTGDLRTLTDTEPPAPPRSKRRPVRCPACSSPRMARIVYGLPVGDDEMQRLLDEGRIVLGGCCVTNDDPAWQCLACGVNVYREGRSR